MGGGGGGGGARDKVAPARAPPPPPPPEHAREPRAGLAEAHHVVDAAVEEGPAVGEAVGLVLEPVEEGGGQHAGEGGAAAVVAEALGRVAAQARGLPHAVDGLPQGAAG